MGKGTKRIGMSRRAALVSGLAAGGAMLSDATAVLAGGLQPNQRLIRGFVASRDDDGYEVFKAGDHMWRLGADLPGVDVAAGYEPGSLVWFVVERVDDGFEDDLDDEPLDPIEAADFIDEFVDRAVRWVVADAPEAVAARAEQDRRAETNSRWVRGTMLAAPRSVDDSARVLLFCDPGGLSSWTVFEPEHLALLRSLPRRSRLRLRIGHGWDGDRLLELKYAGHWMTDA
jgi:hypothetical protein